MKSYNPEPTGAEMRYCSCPYLSIIPSK